MNKAIDVVNPNAKTTVQVTVGERAALNETAARTAKLEGMSKLSARELINKMHQHWKLHLDEQDSIKDVNVKNKLAG